MSKGQLDPNVVELLESVDDFFIQQRIRWGEAITQGCFEQKNIYDVFDKRDNRKIMVIMEESGDLNRCCCAPEHSLFAKFYLVDSTTGEPMGVPVMTMERPGCDCGQPCPKPCLCWFACKEECSDQATLYAGDFGEDAIPGQDVERELLLLGETKQPLGGGRFKPVLQIMERDEESDETHMFAATRGPCFFGGCSELCCSSDFGISKAKDGMGVDEIHELDFDYASITKIRPKNFTQALREAFTDSDLYDVTFTEPVSARQKANVLGTMLLMEYMFFERDNDMCGYDGNAVIITICNCHVYGCICPCQIRLDKDAFNSSSS